MLIGHALFGVSGRRAFGLVPHFLALMVLSRFVKQLRGPGVPTPTKKEAITVLGELLEAGKLTPIVDSTYQLSEVREAFRHMVEDELQAR